MQTHSMENQLGSDLLDMAGALNQASDLTSMHSCLKSMTAALGFDYFNYICKVPLSPTRQYYFLISDMPSEWTDHYRERNYSNIDPVMAYARTQMTPVVWDDLPRDAPIPKSMFEDAVTCGVQHGATAPIYDSGLNGGLFSVARSTPVPKDTDYRQQLLMWMQWIAVQIHQRVHEEVIPDNNHLEHKNLTNRERQCLMWAAEGKTSWEIGQIIGIAEKTVVHHLRGASYKLGSNRRQGAITKAVAFGTLQPDWQEGLASDAAWEGRY